LLKQKIRDGRRHQIDHENGERFSFGKAGVGTEDYNLIILGEVIWDAFRGDEGVYEMGR